MPIAFSCPSCLRAYSVRDDLAGRRVRCKGCDAEIAIPADPSPSVFVPVAPSVSLLDEPSWPAKGDPGHRPFWKDPVFVIGAAVPAAVLIWFGSYLYIDRLRRQHVATILDLRAEADRSYKSDPEAAFAAYGRLIVFAGDGDPHNESARQAIKSARRNRDTLWPQVRARIEAKKAAEERQRLATEAAGKLAAEEARLASFSADVSGAAWMERANGEAELIRGMTLTAIPASVPLRHVRPLIDVMKSVPWLATASDRQYGGVPDDQPIDVKPLCGLLHLAIDGAQGNSEQKYRAFVGEESWPIVLEKLKVASAATSVDGKYSMKGLKGGRYYLCARYFNNFSFMEWVVPLTVEASGPVGLDIFNGNALIIQNKISSE